jgi:HK97 gp10 family phage protein
MAINSKTQTTVEGLDELIDAFMNLGNEAIPFLKTGADQASQVVLAKTKQKAPVDTGNLRDKLKVGKVKSSAKYPYKVFGKITTAKGASYMVPVELGHKLIINGKTVGAVKEQPFLRSAADESKDGVAKIMADAMSKALEQMGGKK